MTTENTGLWRQPKAVALLMAASLTVMANATISPALAGLQQEFADVPDAGFLVRLLVTAPSLGVMLAAPLAGWLTDRAGRRRVLLAGIWLFILCGTAGFYLPDLHLMLASRFGLGLAVALIMTAQTALIGDYFTGTRRQALTGLQISARNFGGLVFIGLAGLAATLSPRLPFLIYGLAAVGLYTVWRFAAEPDRTGAGQAQAEGAGHPAWLALVIAVSGLQMLTNGLFFMMPTQLPFFFASQGLNSALMTGAGLGLLSLCGGLTALAYARFKGSLPHAAVFAAGYSALALGFAVLAQEGSPALSLSGAMAVGVGYATVSPGFVAIALALAPAGRRGTAGAILTASVFCGQFLSPFASTPAIAQWGYGGAFGAAAAVLALMAAAALAAALHTARRRAPA
ncbi:MFS transporter [Leisingera aquaemixtae]|uniref:Multidrug efflux system translocase MdfA n=1 Tax=Leisingera aquaemixtae TaxID=1396826 RepID=A0A0P1H9E3_9RHOB|nr:MFS transporter [Leisingera aquaemixtae]CUH99931.1 multidrug efflux system translocase MdfA [Leisingera aquaemixtae]